MNYILGLILALHGIVHIVGFIVPWRLLTTAGTDYHTTILGGALDIGDGGMRALGVVWLIVAALFLTAGYASATQQVWWMPLAFALAAVSLMLCLLELPETIFGVLLNAALIVFLAVGARLGWLAPAS
jgi:hypothetical protein